MKYFIISLILIFFSLVLVSVVPVFENNKEVTILISCGVTLIIILFLRFFEKRKSKNIVTTNFPLTTNSTISTIPNSLLESGSKIDSATDSWTNVSEDDVEEDPHQPSPHAKGNFEDDYMHYM